VTPSRQAIIRKFLFIQEKVPRTASRWQRFEFKFLGVTLVPFSAVSWSRPAQPLWSCEHYEMYIHCHLKVMTGWGLLQDVRRINICVFKANIRQCRKASNYIGWRSEFVATFPAFCTRSTQGITRTEQLCPSLRFALEPRERLLVILGIDGGGLH
jgi:hypothetical protein